MSEKTTISVERHEISVERHEFYTYVRIGRTGAMLGEIDDPRGGPRQVLTISDYTEESSPVRATVDPPTGVDFEELFEVLSILRAEVAARAPRSVREYVEEREDFAGISGGDNG